MTKEELLNIYYSNPINTFIRTGNGDRRATETEVMAMMRDQVSDQASDQATQNNDITYLKKGLNL
ncbi:MAG: hypothetical protein SPK61_02750 [Bacteroidales bacterium]|nr:hypothetical protein [Bacteroidales bacterium]MDY6426915.1 hypothetical protein [Bacteroidales bacterium]